MATELAPFIGGHSDKPVATTRKDTWWIEVVITLVVFTGFIVYTTWAAFQGKHYYSSPYLSPFYSPVLFTNESLGVVGAAPSWHAWFGPWPSWWPSFLPPSPAFFILTFPALFRFTCYYYRKAYYRAFVFSPPGCSVVPAGQGVGKYQGETRILIYQNLHRYAFYFAFVFIFILYFDAFLAFFHHGEFGVGVGTIIMLVNASLIAAYTFGCHSFRHLVGGRSDTLSGGRNTFRFKLWKLATWFNERHMPFAWVSLFGVALTDVYIRLVSMGVIRDLNTWDM